MSASVILWTVCSRTYNWRHSGRRPPRRTATCSRSSWCNGPADLALKANATRYVDDQGAEVGRALLFCDVTAEQRVQVELSQAVARRLLALTSGHMPPEPVANLTHQEVRILRLVGRGLGNEEIAEEAGISPSTVRSHLKSLYRKLGLHSRAEAVSYAARNNLA